MDSRDEETDDEGGGKDADWDSGRDIWKGRRPEWFRKAPVFYLMGSIGLADASACTFA